MEASTTYRFDNMKDLKEGLKHLNNVQVAQSR
jgi:hypothetical protein